MPISTLYASPEKRRSDLFCAFQPSRVIVPSLPLRLGRPAMPRELLAAPLAAWLARIALSGICSTSPSPNVGVGVRKITLLLATWIAKFSCEIEQPGASLRPAVTNSAWTPPSRVLSGLNLNRASRMGPSGLMKEGTTLLAPRNVATATWGFGAGVQPGPRLRKGAGDVPPVAGCV